MLGPILWDLFLDDIVPALSAGLPPGVRIEVVLYADDINVCLRGKDLGTLYKAAQRVLDSLSDWEVVNDARVSLEKTSVTVFTPSRALLPKEQRPRLTFPDQSAEPPFRGIRRVVDYAEQPKLLGLLYESLERKPG